MANPPTLRGLSIGAGYFAQFHFDAWRRVDGAELVGICDSDAGKAAAAAQQHGVAGSFSDFDQAIDALKPDFVDIITPPDSHLDLVRRAAQRGLPIICQKALAPDLRTAEQVVAAAADAGVPLMVHENFRFQPWHREIKRLMDGGAVGRVHSISFRTRMGDGWGEDAYLGRQPYFRTMPRLLVFETGVHFIDTFRYLAGEVDSIYALLRRLNPVIAGEDAGTLTLRMASGAVCTWDANRFNESTDANPRLTFGQMLVEGDSGSLRLWGDGAITLQPLGEAERPHDYTFSTEGFAGDCVRATQQHFIDCLRSGAPFETAGAQYLKSLRVVEAAYQSSLVDRPVRPEGLPTTRVIDLSRPIDNQMPGVAISPAKTIAKEGWNATTLSLYSHAGTHIDAPRHFIDGAAPLDAQDLAVCVGPAKLIDLTPVEPAELITVARLSDWADRIEAGDRLLLRTDWSLRYPAPEYRDALPRISLELAEWLVAKRVALVGVEPPSVADVNNMRELTDVHQALFRGGVTIVEGLVGLDRLVGHEFELIALPLKIAGGDGSPIRAVAVLRSSSDV
ncbi:Kynurenine formamidase [Pirellulimonas nuda]|uniref:Kynurenine formamidase n=1 Tax=Pirellulimonas nuda TaxID=2528009 RepID=A0A518DJM8_9BACT|nr:cyclase family protein [Pirellulimonas nuda]QDU91680.1 Kynurenine formamidase [Pirellulimonas nuda]